MDRTLIKACTLGVAIIIGLAAPAAALEKIQSRDTFVSQVQGQTLNTRYLGVAINLQVSPDGAISGSALGTDITGTWNWDDGYFCRKLQWGSRDIPFNCQLVQASGNTMRFTTDRGAGRSADFSLR